MSYSVPPAALARSAWRPYIDDFVRRVLRIVPDDAVLTSWFRTASVNRSVGGHRESQHLFALGSDWDGPARSLDAIIYYAPLVGLVAVDSGGYVHLQRFQHGALRRAGVLFPT